MNKSTEQLNRNGDKRGMSLNSQKNLLGVQGIGNPKNNHAKKELSITRKQREMLTEKCPYAPTKTWLEWLAERGMAMAGENATYYKELMDRLEGKIVQPIQAEHEITYKIEWDDRAKNTFTDTTLKTVGVHTISGQAENN